MHGVLAWAARPAGRRPSPEQRPLAALPATHGDAGSQGSGRGARGDAQLAKRAASRRVQAPRVARHQPIGLAEACRRAGDADSTGWANPAWRPKAQQNHVFSKQEYTRCMSCPPSPLLSYI